MSTEGVSDRGSIDRTSIDIGIPKKPPESPRKKNIAALEQVAPRPLDSEEEIRTQQKLALDSKALKDLREFASDWKEDVSKYQVLFTGKQVDETHAKMKQLRARIDELDTKFKGAPAGFLEELKKTLEETYRTVQVELRPVTEHNIYIFEHRVLPKKAEEQSQKVKAAIDALPGKIDALVKNAKDVLIAQSKTAAKELEKMALEWGVEARFSKFTPEPGVNRKVRNIQKQVFQNTEKAHKKEFSKQLEARVSQIDKFISEVDIKFKDSDKEFRDRLKKGLEKVKSSLKTVVKKVGKDAISAQKTCNQVRQQFQELVLLQLSKGGLL